MITLQTDRLLLRPWREEDLEPFVQLNADPRVMEYFPAVKTREETLDEYQRFQEHFIKHRWGFWAASVIDGAAFIGFIGLRQIDFSVPFAPAIDIGWRLAFDFWGKGYATEGAKACLKYGFKTLKLKEIVSFTAVQNKRSRAVMERIGMHRTAKDDFDNPKLPEGHLLRRHVLYRIAASEFIPASPK